MAEGNMLSLTQRFGSLNVSKSSVLEIWSPNDDAVIDTTKTTVLIEAASDIFTVIRLLFLGSAGRMQGNICFNHASFLSGTIGTPSQRRVAALKERHTTGDVDMCFELTLEYNFDAVIVENIGSDLMLQTFDEYLRSGQALRMYVKGSSTQISRNFEHVFKTLRIEHTMSPLDHLHGGFERCYKPKEIKIMSSKIKIQSRTLAGRRNFHNTDHYLTLQAAANQIEQNIAEEKAEELRTQEHKVFIALADQFDEDGYRIYLPPSVNRGMRIAPGDTIKLLFERHSDWDKAWTVNVQLPPSQAPNNYLSGYMRCPAKRKADTEPKPGYNHCKAFCTEARHSDCRNFPGAQHYMMAKVSVLVHDGLVRRRLECMESMNQGQFGDEMARAVEQALVCRKLNEIPTFDIFRRIRAEHNGHPESLIQNLNNDQQSAVDMGKNTMAGIVLVQGPPGTGKTHLAVNLITPWIKTKSKRNVLVSTQTNDGTDNLSRLFQQHIDTLNTSNPDAAFLKSKYVVRVNKEDVAAVTYAQRTLEQYFKADSTGHGAGSNLTEVTLAVKNFLLTIRKAHGYTERKIGPKAGIEKGSQHVEQLSFAYRLLQRIGIEPGGPLVDDQETYAIIRNIFNDRDEREKLNKDEAGKLYVTLKRLCRRVLEDATVVCSTVTNAGSEFVGKSLSEVTDLVICDEMPCCLEADALMLLMGHIRPSGYFVIGDPDQLGPHVDSFREDESDNKNPFVHQLRMSVQERWQSAGFPYTFLSVQHRMDPNLAEDTNTIIYDGKLEDHESTKNRELVVELEAFNQLKFSVKTNKLLVDMPEDEGERRTSITRLSGNKSRYNEDHVMYCINLAEELVKKFPSATVGILTGYYAQFHLLQQAKRKMPRQNSSGHDRIHVYRVGTVQGLEFDFVILDMLFVSRGSAGFFRDRRRMNVATSRARNGMYILMNISAYDSIEDRDRDNSWVRRYVERWLHVQCRANTEGLRCRYHEAGSVDNDTGRLMW